MLPGRKTEQEHENKPRRKRIRQREAILAKKRNGLKLSKAEEKKIRKKSRDTYGTIVQTYAVASRRNVGGHGSLVNVAHAEKHWVNVFA